MVFLFTNMYKEVEGVELHVISHRMSVNYKLPVNESAVMIRILDPQEEFKAVVNEFQYREIISLNFSDLTLEQVERIGNQEEWSLISKKDSIAILDFYKRNSDVQHFVIHCAAGISRSAGVALALSIYRNDLGWANKVWEECIPNMYVANKIVSLFSSEVLEDIKIRDNSVEEFSWSF